MLNFPHDPMLECRRTVKIRYPTEHRSRTLLHSASIEAIRELAPEAERFSPNARAIVSEPLGELAEAWVSVPESSFVTIHDCKVVCESFEPRLP